MARVPALEDLGDVAGKRVLVRTDFNVPMEGPDDRRVITDDFRIRAALPTIEWLTSRGAHVVCASHLGRPKGPPAAHPRGLSKATRYSMEPVRARLAELAPGVELLENLRFNPGEESNSPEFAASLIKGIDMYVNDAFGAAHRAHASTTQLASFFPNAKMAGLLMNAEIENAKKVLLHAERPFTAIVGGAKVSDKILIVENLLNLADHIIIGGGMAYTFFKALGGHIGNSLCETERLDTCLEILNKAKTKGVQIHLPTDAIAADRFAADANTQIEPSNAISEDRMGLDIGPKAIADFEAVLLQSKTILWNGPMGVFEMPAFENGTKSMALAVASATKNGAFSLIGGGDSAAAVQKFELSSQVSYVSTGGGALLEYFEGKVLPGVEALEA